MDKRNKTTLDTQRRQFRCYDYNLDTVSGSEVIQNRDMEDMAFEVLTKAITNAAVLDVTPCSLVQIYPDLGGASAVFCHKEGSTDHVGRLLHYRMSPPTRHCFDMRGCS